MPKMERDLFAPIVDTKRLNPSYEYMRTSPVSEPARIMANEVFQDFPNPDDNFIEQFQTSGYDSRIFELYLYAYLSWSGFQVNRHYDRPDFFASRNGLTIAIEATTVNPTQTIGSSITKTRMSDLSKDELQEKLQNELPIRFGSPLFSKLSNRYWELEQCQEIPLVFAIEALHEAGSLYYTDSSLGRYLYGLRHYPDWTEEGQLVVKSEAIGKHVWGSKIILSNFFQQPDTEHVSAVIFSNSGTYAKFNRMGYQAGYHRGNIKMVRRGVCYDPDPNATQPIQFTYDLDHPPVLETWGQGLMVFYNPNALLPIPSDYFPDAAQTYIEDGQMKSDLPGFHPFMSQTVQIPIKRRIFDSPKEADLPIESILKNEFEGFKPARNPALTIIADEKEWFADKNRVILGVLLLDRTDRDWTYAVLGRDEAGVFRWIDGQSSIKTRDKARNQLLATMLRIYESGQSVFPQA